MSILSDRQIHALCTPPETLSPGESFTPMISPFIPKSIKEINEVGTDGDRHFKTLSFGLTSYGYDVRLDYDFKIFTNVHGGELDPKKASNNYLVEGIIRQAEDGSHYVILPPNSYLLGVTMEYFKMPRDVLGVCLGKSTMARIGLLVNCTPIEPGFEGNVVIELANSTSLPMRVYAGEGIAQVIMLRGSEPCEVSYADRNSKYQGQRGITLAKV